MSLVLAVDRSGLEGLQEQRGVSRPGGPSAVPTALLPDVPFPTSNSSTPRLPQPPR